MGDMNKDKVLTYFKALLRKIINLEKGIYEEFSIVVIYLKNSNSY